MMTARRKIVSFGGLVLVGLLASAGSLLADDDECDVDDCIKVVAEIVECTEGWTCSDGMPRINQIGCSQA